MGMMLDRICYTINLIDYYINNACIYLSLLLLLLIIFLHFYNTITITITITITMPRQSHPARPYDYLTRVGN